MDFKIVVGENGTYYPYCVCSNPSASCIDPICSVCGYESPESAIHSVENGKCTVCGKECLVIETAHDTNDEYNYEVLGTWDYSGAKSVDITIECQISYGDYFLIRSGTDFISGDYDSIYNEKRNYLSTSGSILSTFGNDDEVHLRSGTKIAKTFSNVNMTSGTVIFDCDSECWGGKVTVTPNY